MDQTIFNRQGQGVLESLLSIPLLTLIVTGLFILCYRAVVFFYSDYCLHEALICVDSKLRSICERELSQEIGKILLSESDKVLSQKIQLIQTGDVLYGSIEIQFSHFPSPFNSNLVLKKQLRLPVEAPIEGSENNATAATRRKRGGPLLGGRTS